MTEGTRGSRRLVVMVGLEVGEASRRQTVLTITCYGKVVSLSSPLIGRSTKSHEHAARPDHKAPLTRYFPVANAGTANLPSALAAT